ncbi:MAG: MarR family winged helix-turn-helix transcriptional regulator [Wohlfahrtiimonas sp.]
MGNTTDLIDTIVSDWAKTDITLNTNGTEVVGRIVRLASLISRKVDANLAEYELNVGEFDVLAALLRADDHSLAPFELQDLMLVSSGGLSNRMKRLEKNGLITRAQAKEDGRGVAVQLTKAGKALIEKAVLSHLAIENALIESMQKADAESLQHLLRGLLLALDHD